MGLVGSRGRKSLPYPKQSSERVCDIRKGSTGMKGLNVILGAPFSSKMFYIFLP